MTDDARLAILGQFTPEGYLMPGYGDHYLFLVGRDDCHGILHYLIPREPAMFKFNMFGYDDDELDNDVEQLFADPNVRVQASFDKSQAGGVHERKILARLQAKVGAEWGTSFVVGQSATHQISHTKGGVLVGQGVGFEGSMNWSDSGEGTGIDLKVDAGRPRGFKAQNNTLLVSTNPVFIARFGARLDVEHQDMIAAAAKAAT